MWKEIDRVEYLSIWRLCPSSIPVGCSMIFYDGRGRARVKHSNPDTYYKWEDKNDNA